MTVTSRLSRSLPSLVLAVAAAACGRAGTAAPSAPPCGHTYKDLAAAAHGAEYACHCDAAAAKGTVWGVDTYTQDSSVCAAAVHAGAIPASGGDVRVAPAAGCATYAGSTRNGVATSGWGTFPASFYFVGKGTGACAGGAAPVVAAPAAPPAPPPAACPATFTAIPNATSVTTLTCSCAGPTPGSVWGAGIYTQDSSICGAAVHAGAIPTTGGVVTLRAAPGCGKYLGDARNGVTSQGWGAYAGSFYFDGKGDGRCVP